MEIRSTTLDTVFKEGLPEEAAFDSENWMMRSRSWEVIREDVSKYVKLTLVYRQILFQRRFDSAQYQNPTHVF